MYTGKLSLSSQISEDDLYQVLKKCIEEEDSIHWFWKFREYCDLYFQDIAIKKWRVNKYMEMKVSEKQFQFDDFLQHLFDDTMDAIITTVHAIRLALLQEENTTDQSTSVNISQENLKFLYFDRVNILLQARNAICKQINLILDTPDRRFISKK